MLGGILSKQVCVHGRILVVFTNKHAICVERVLQDFLPAPPSFSSALPAGRSTDLSCSGISMSSKKECFG